jgi:cytochrome c-type biogenesis protein CcmH
MFFVFAVLTAGVILAVTRPLSRGASALPDVNPDIEAFKAQLAELDREQESGTLSKEEAGQLRIEISRRALRANRQGHAAISESAVSRLSANRIFLGLAVAISIGSLALYVTFGKFGLPDQPLAERLAVAPEKQSIEIQVANVERALRKNPKDATGWSVIAPVYLRLKKFDKAADAYRRVMELSGESEDRLLGFAEALTFGSEGTIPALAKEAMAQAVKLNPKSLRARFWLALYAEQEGRIAEAEQIYRAMISENIPDNWERIAEARLMELGRRRALAQTGVPDGEQGAMIRGMVDGLAARLKENGADLDGWLKLIRSYTVLKEADKALEAVASAQAQFASQPDALSKITTLQQELHLSPASGDATQGQKQP